MPVSADRTVQALVFRESVQGRPHSRMKRYSQLILDAENVTVKRCNTLNPATLLSVFSKFANEGDDHDCLEVTEL